MREALLQEPEIIELETLDNPPKHAFVPLLRRESAASTVSHTSSQHEKNYRRFIKRILGYISTLLGSLGSNIREKIRRSRFYGWRMGLLIGSCTTAFVLCCNITAVLVAGIRDDKTSDTIKVITVMTGSSTAISRWSTFFHFLINVLSTLLLGASNYTMQVLASPTRSDIDVAHAKGLWLDVGLLSVRNLRFLPRGRIALSLMLGLSSIPLHLFYNAALFQITVANQYDIHAISIGSEDWAKISSRDNVRNLTNDQWMEIYATPYLSGYDDLYLVIDRLAFEPFQNVTTGSNVDHLPLNIRNSSNEAIRNFTNGAMPWINYTMFAGYALRDNKSSGAWPYNARVAYGLSNISNVESRIQISQDFMIIVICFNFAKLVIILWVLIADKSEYLVTLGDAAASFLERPDSSTVGKCMLGKEEHLFQLGYRIAKNLDSQNQGRFQQRLLGAWLPDRLRHSASLSEDRQLLLAIM
ncbi:hypothetical protein Ptr902_02695 [Pyrenophora tritici-repentis]|nr:hypothetical protein Ptr902_02695 [Pyrenophora tritici-repentis]